MFITQTLQSPFIRQSRAALVACGIGLLTLTATSFAQTTGAAATTSARPLAAADKTFIDMAAKGGLAEVAMSRMAQQKASSAQVKQFAERMEQDHAKANTELMALAQRKGVQAPAELDAAHKKDADMLSKSSAAAFDRDHMSHMVMNHKKKFAALEKASRSSDADVAALATKTLPILQEHLRMAQTLNDSLKQGK